MLLLSQDEFVDVLLCLTRVNILMVAFTSRKLRAAVDVLPANRCLLRLSEVVLTKKRDYRWQESLGLSGGVRRILFGFLVESVRPYKLRICPSSHRLCWVTWRSSTSSKMISAFLSAIRNASVSYARIDLPRIPRKFEEMILQSATTSGRIDELVVNAEGLKVPPSVFEAIPFLAAEVESLQFSYPSNLTLRPTPVRQSEKLLRNCIDRGVYSLKLIDKERHCRVPYKPREKSSDISEETILEFCFAPRNVRPDRPEQVELWLNCVNLSPEFLSRFVQASETCDSDHKVKLLLRDANVCQQNLSQFHRHDLTDWYYDGRPLRSIWANGGKYTVRVVRNLRMGFFFAHRSTLSLEEWSSDSDGFAMNEHDLFKGIPKL